jgi:hypothetical protein
MLYILQLKCNSSPSSDFYKPLFKTFIETKLLYVLGNSCWLLVSGSTTIVTSTGHPDDAESSGEEGPPGDTEKLLYFIHSSGDDQHIRTPR